VEINAPGALSTNIIGQACLRNHTDVLEYFLKMGGNLSLANAVGLPPIFVTCFRKRDPLQMMEVLLVHGADISSTVRDKMGRTILHCAVLSGKVELVKYLLEKEPGLVNEKDKDGWAALHWALRRPFHYIEQGCASQPASRQDQVEMIKFLLENGHPGLEDSVSGGQHTWNILESDDTWNILELARYFGVPEEAYEILHSKVQESGLMKSGEAVREGEKFEGMICNGCYCEIRGISYHCEAESCWQTFKLCSKCIRFKELIHEISHPFEQIEYKVDEQTRESEYSVTENSQEDLIEI